MFHTNVTYTIVYHLPVYIFDLGNEKNRKPNQHHYIDGRINMLYHSKIVKMTESQRFHLTKSNVYEKLSSAE